MPTPTNADAILAETIAVTGHSGDEIEAYRAVPLAPGSRGGIVWIHHMPGYDRETKEFVRRLAVDGLQRRYARICTGARRPAPTRMTPRPPPALQAACPTSGWWAMSRARSSTCAGWTAPMGEIGVIGHCSGGRHAFLAACSLKLDAAVDCYGAFVVEEPPEGMPRTMQPILGLAPNLSCPLLGLFGKDDRYPSPESVAALDDELTRLGKEHEFHSYDGAGHSFFSVDRPAYRIEAAIDGWQKIDDFFGRLVAG